MKVRQNGENETSVMEALRHFVAANAHRVCADFKNDLFLNK